MDGRGTTSRTAGVVDTVLETSVVGSFTRLGPLLRARFEHWEQPPSTPGRVVVITGASSGLGREAALELGSLGCHVVCVGRDQTRLDEVVEKIRAVDGKATAERCDLGDLAQTMQLARRLRGTHRSIDVLIHNAGALSADRREGPQGFELTVTVHVLSPYLLTELLRTRLEAADRAKVVLMTSGGMYTERFDLGALEMDAASYKGSVAYARAKRAQVVLVAAWQRHEPDGAMDFHAVHPGWARTPGVADSLPRFDKLLRPLLRTPAEGVDTLVWLATSPPGTPQGGHLWLDRKPRSTHRLARTKVDRFQALAEQDELLGWLAATTAPFRALEED